jgi:hypothetical protein
MEETLLNENDVLSAAESAISKKKIRDQNN